MLRFLGNELPDPSIGVSVWSDSILQTLYDAIHAVALTNAGATSLMHEARACRAVGDMLQLEHVRARSPG